MSWFGKEKKEIIRNYSADISDITLAFNEVTLERYGKSAICSVKSALFFDIPVAYTSIEIDCGKNAMGVTGTLRINTEKLQAEFNICPEDASGRKIPAVICLVDSEFENEANEFLSAIGEYIKKYSIYRCKAITINYGFLDLSKIDQKNFIYNKEVLKQIQTHIWTLIENTERCKKENVPLHRKVLLTGPFGAGKTFTAFLTAKKAVENGWTFLYMRPTDPGDGYAIARLYKIARQYSPAVVFIEDIDHEQSGGDDYTLHRNLSEIDGLISKNDEIITILTANRTEKISGAMQRPGRIDKIIKMGILETKDMERFIKTLIRTDLLEENIDWEKVSKHCDKYPPAFLREMATNALLNMIGHNQDKIGTEFLVQAADDLKDQFKACEHAMGFK